VHAGSTFAGGVLAGSVGLLPFSGSHGRTKLDLWLSAATAALIERKEPRYDTEHEVLDGESRQPDHLGHVGDDPACPGQLGGEREADEARHHAHSEAADDNGRERQTPAQPLGDEDEDQAIGGTGDHVDH